nr:hypothetical protein [Fischerella sp. FACHB-380]
MAAQPNQPSQQAGSEANILSSLLAPLQAELQTLLQERANLVQEIKELEQRRLQNFSLAQQLANQEQLIANFLQVLSNRLGGNTQPKMPINILNSTPETPLALGEASSSSTSNKDNTEQFAFANSPTLEPQDQLERLTRLASELDQKLLALDGTVNVVFEALQRNIHTYHESLSQALARMYSQGLQGEQLFSNLINNLAQQAQLQFTAKEPFTIDIQKQTLANDSRTLQSSNKIEQLKTDGQTAEIDTVIAQLNQDTPNSPDTASDFAIDQLHQDSSVSIRDEVDQLYASLFGVDNLATSNPEFSSQQTNFEVIDSIENLLVEETATNQEKSDFTEALSVDEVKLANQEQAETFLQEVLFEVADPTELPVDEQASINQDEGELILQEVLFEVAEPRDFSVDEQATINQDEGELILQEVLFEVAESTELSTDEQVTNNQEELDLILQEVLFECADPTEELPVDAAASSDNMSIIDTQSAPTINEIQPVQPPVSASDPWFDEPDAGLLEGGNIQVEDTQKATNEKIREQLLELWEKITFTEAENETPSLPVEEPTADQITSLNNLSFNTSNEQPLTVNSVHESVISTTPDLTPTEENSGDRTLNDSSDNYIPASPQENLLIQAENQNAAIPEIALDAEQLLQLDQDLANFGEQTNPQLQPLTDLEIPDSAHSAQSVETENKESTTVSSEQMLSRDSNFGDDTEIRSNIGDYVWYLGIDIGTTGISATLLNRSTNEIYPLYWSTENQAETVSKTRTFRLPAEVYLPPAQEQDTTTSNLFSAQLKPYLQIALPYKNEQQKWEPILQFNEVATVPLVWVIRSLSKLLSTLKLDRSSTTLGLTAAGVGLNQQIFHSAINNLAGVICTCPSHWAEQYRFNIREALLLSKIIQHPQQVFFVEEAIASLLSELDGANGEIIQFGNSQESHSAKTSEYPLVGNTLVMNIGAAATEMALVDLPESLEELTHSDFMLHNFAYAGKGIEQDIICQLLLPTKWRKPRNSSHEGNNTTITSSPLQWQPMIAGVEQMSFASLGLEELKLPRPGEPDTSDRIKLQQRLESSVLGKAVLDAAVALKLILQHQESFTLELADQCWVLQRRDLESQVFVPFVRRLNRELNKLLVAKGIPTEAINQAILTGGTSSLAAVSRWLRQKLPNAKIIQDLYLNENGTPSCSRVAYGLAMLPLHPQVLEVPRQQYTDYFLFTELLRLIPDRALSFNEIIQLFEARGINTRSCQQRLLAFLEGELPPGLLPSNVDFSWLSLTSRENFDYKAIANAPLFEKQGSLTYRPNSSQLQSLRRHLDAIKGSTQQSLEEPYTVNFVINVSSQRVP